MNIKWRGTWGIGDAMMALNVAHNYSFTHDTPVKLEMHWSHDEDFILDKRDTQTIVEQQKFLHDQYYQNDRVELTHVFKTTLFDYSIPYVQDMRRDKARWYFDEIVNRNIVKFMNWPFKDIPKPKNSFMIEDNLKGVCWTPMHNSEPPREWKRDLTEEDWKLSKERFGSIADITEISYRTPVQNAFQIIKESDFVFCYEGMWHFIARNFAKPIVIQARVITEAKQNTPQVKQLYSREDYLEWLDKPVRTNITGMQNRAREYYKRLIKYYED